MDTVRIANLNDLSSPREQSHGERYASRHFPLGTLLGAVRLGFNLTEIPPGKTAFPYHCHHVNEEMFLVLEGTGTIRTPDGTRPLRAGDVVCCPPGPGGAHQISNTGERPLRYLALSTLLDPEVVQYPDSRKYAVTAGRKPGGRIWDAAFFAMAFETPPVDYWAGEGD